MSKEPTSTGSAATQVVRFFDHDWNFGSMIGRQLCLRWHVSWHFRAWVDGQYSFAPLKILNPLRWFRAARDRCNWRLSCRRFTGATHRCYCDTGSMIDGSVVVFGFGVTWFYSHFTGSVPCPCDTAFEEMYDER